MAQLSSHESPSGCYVSPLARNLAEARLAVDFVTKHLDIKSADKVKDVVGSLGMSVIGRVGAYTQERIQWLTIKNRTPLQDMRIRACSAICHRAGNCGEQAAIAFMFLYDRGVRPIDYMSRVNANHAFVVIGRKLPSKASAPSTWGKDAVICDPWAGHAYAARLSRHRMKGTLAPISEWLEV